MISSNSKHCPELRMRLPPQYSSSLFNVARLANPQSYLSAFCSLQVSGFRLDSFLQQKSCEVLVIKLIFQVLTLLEASS